MKRFTILIVLFLGACFAFAQNQTQSTKPDAVETYKKAQKDYMDASMDLDRLNIRQQKRDIIKKMIPFTDEQSKAFWPIYDKFEANYIKVNDIRYNLIKDYAANYDTMTDDKAAEFITKYIEFQDKRIALKRGYLSEIKSILPPKMVARLFQLENQMDLSVDLNIASQLPLVK
ncbi:MAG: hypothetical protein C5B54_03545 [Acidobacteria bacterium]|nr:MAG: hypothetical protein C5B54_03545 [Acidobacteriota bacterium]